MHRHSQVSRLTPMGRTSLRIAIHQDDAIPLTGQLGGKMHGNRYLTGTALPSGDANRLHFFPVLGMESTICFTMFQNVALFSVSSGRLLLCFDALAPKR